ncbi:MAG: 1-phosphofructokinase family hexose kinase [Chitinophagaceae bacterium]
MKQIVTITFSPCIDRSATVAKMIPEKKLKCTSPKLEPGGGGINVARVINRFGGNCTAVFPVGGYTGRYLFTMLQQEKVPCHIIETQEETRENVIVFEEQHQQQYRFGMPGVPLADHEWQRLLATLESMTDVDYIVASGSLPPGVPEDIYYRIAILANKTGAKLIVDTSGEPLKHALRASVFLIKPNLAELSYIAGKPDLDVGEIPLVAKQVLTEGNCQAIVVSLGKNGAMLVTKTAVKKILSPLVQSVSTVGAGDSMVAGMAFSLSQGESLETAVQFGIACGTAATLTPGTGLCHPEEVIRLLRQMNEEKQFEDIRS